MYEEYKNVGRDRIDPRVFNLDPEVTKANYIARYGQEAWEKHQAEDNKKAKQEVAEMTARAKREGRL